MPAVRLTSVNVSAFARIKACDRCLLRNQGIASSCDPLARSRPTHVGPAVGIAAETDTAQFLKGRGQADFSEELRALAFKASDFKHALFLRPEPPHSRLTAPHPPRSSMQAAQVMRTSTRLEGVSAELPYPFSNAFKTF